MRRKATRLDLFVRLQRGQLGDGNTSPSNTPVAVTGLTGVTQIAVGGQFACALASGIVQCWGLNNAGQLGNNTQVNSDVPLTIPGLSGVVAITAAVNGSHACALLSSGTVECWGYNGSGQLGNGTLTSSGYPVVVSGLTGVTQIVAEGATTCALLSTSYVDCWGDNTVGQDGQSNYGGYYATPVSVDVTSYVNKLNGVTQLTAGSGFACGLMSTGAVDCWGSASNDELGNSSNILHVALPVTGLTGVTQVTSGYDSGDRSARRFSRCARARL